MIAAVPSDQVVGAFPGPGFAWTLAGKPVPFGPIAVETIAGPVLALGGRMDEIWDSSGSVARILDRARMHGRRDIAHLDHPAHVLSMKACVSHVNSTEPDSCWRAWARNTPRVRAASRLL